MDAAPARNEGAVLARYGSAALAVLALGSRFDAPSFVPLKGGSTAVKPAQRQALQHGSFTGSSLYFIARPIYTQQDRVYALMGCLRLALQGTSVATGLVVAAAKLRSSRRKSRGMQQRIQAIVRCAADQDVCPGSVTEGEMPGRYDFAAVEEELYLWWESRGFFKPEIADQIAPGAGKHESYVIPMPPPNVTGRLHMGHAMFASLEDVMARFHRMYGHRTLWLPGTDHAGIATQMLVERQLVAEGTSRKEVGRDAFLERVWSWKEEKGSAIVDQLRRIGASCDWSRQQFTLNEHMSGAVIEAFIRLHEMGLVFKGQRMVNWSPVLQTAVSDLEVEYDEVSGFLYHFKYVVAGEDGQPTDEYIPVATTRPETILGDSAVCVHPEDPRYQSLIGKEVLVPMQGRKIPVIADEYVDREFGTGALKITPAHDFNDFEIGQRFDLPNHVVIGLDGTMSQNVIQLGSPDYAGLSREKCRKQLWADLEEAGLTLKKDDYMQRVPLSQRSGEVIEPMLSDQWFVKTEEMAQKSMDAVASGEIKIQPERYTKIWDGWLKEKQPWCISRQLWWGHRIPVYYPVNRPDANGKYYVAASMDDAQEKARADFGDDVELEQDPDVLDTWFSSGLWPFATVGWPDETNSDFKDFYPAAMLETGYDILFFWVARMVMMGITLTGKSPFSEIYLHGLVRDGNGQKMSKTKGNVVDPLESIKVCGTDALRYALLTSSVAGQDTPLAQGVIDNAKSFANKIWNTGKFVLTELEKNQAKLSAECTTGMTFSDDEIRAMPWLERALISKCHGVIENVTQSLLANSFAPPTKVLKEFIQEDFAAWYIEASKTRLQEQLGGDVSSPEGTVSQRVLLYILDTSLRLLHPFMPFVTEAVWQRLPRGASDPDSLMITSWRDVSAGALFRDPEAESYFEKMCPMVTAIRNVRAKQEIPPKERVALTFWCKDPAYLEALKAEIPAVAWLTRADPTKVEVKDFAGRGETPEGSVRTIVNEELEIDMPVPEKEVDIEQEQRRLEKQLKFITGQLESTIKKITPQFMERSNPIAREKILAKRDELEQTKAAVEQQLQDLRSQHGEGDSQPSRRTVAAALFASIGLGAAAPARANVGEGDMLPNGARQEDRLRKGSDAWKELAVKLKGMEAISDEEWQNTQGFLRRLYTLNDDMIYLSRGFPADQKKKADELIDAFKKDVKALDKPAKAKDLPAFMDGHAKVVVYLKDFQESLQDATADIDVDAEAEAVDIV
mmetsp:Transcript_83519/g.215088  ORF Transcript_83519/g.215088 Transcript_83519/m.215088 type:complete len:1240 (-) Transcript_83519:194-3913(-)